MYKSKPKYFINIIDNVFKIINFLSKKGDYISIKKISDELNFYPSHVHKILNNLKYHGIVEQDPYSKKYGLGMRLLELGFSKLCLIDIVKVSKPYLKKLRDELNETVHLGAIDNNKVVYLAKEESFRKIQMTSRVGSLVSIHSSALGKAILAFLPEEEKERILNNYNFEKYTENTILNKKELLKELEEIKKNGFSKDKEEYEKGVRCIGAPIKDFNGRCIAAISVSYFTFFQNRKNFKSIVNKTINTSKEISKRLGTKNLKS